MKLLLADDEIITRKGLLDSIDWNALGIRTVLEANDGINAVEIAEAEHPDIVLSDIRMPRMNGIELVKRLSQILPDSSFIFMSGYSDKEYLKAAVRLNVVDYIEKPIDLSELTTCLKEACRQRQQALLSKKGQDVLSLDTASKLALFLTKPYKDHQDEIQDLFASLHFKPTQYNSYVTYIVKTESADTDHSATQAYQNFLSILKQYHIHCCHTKIHAVHHVFHLMCDTVISSNGFSLIENELRSLFANDGTYYIGRGDVVTSLGKIYKSYTNAVILLQSSFFFPAQTILYSDRFAQLPLEAENNYDHLDTHGFQSALLSSDWTEMENYLNDLYAHYSKNRALLPNQVKDLYYRLLLILGNCCVKNKISSLISEVNLMDYLESCFTFDGLHHFLYEKVSQYNKKIQAHAPEDPTIFHIKDYIAKNYAHDNLSVKEISDHVFLSASYICTYFKSQTGQTLNQYITQYRMEKAMELLQDARYPIADISSKVGYSNGNYFGKSFKKHTGLSPSQYREQQLG